MTATTDMQHYVRPDSNSSLKNSPLEDRRACLGALTAGLASMLIPKAVFANEDPSEGEVDAPVPIDLAILQKVVGTYEVRREWLFEGKVLVEKPQFTVTTGSLGEDLQPEWVEHWRVPIVPLTTEIRVVNGRLEVHANFKWLPPNLEEVGPGPILSAPVDGRRERVPGGRGPMRLLYAEERDEYNVKLVDGVRHVQEWWVRRSSKSSWEGVKTRTVTLWIESPGMLALRVNEFQSVADHAWHSTASLRFQKIA